MWWLQHDRQETSGNISSRGEYQSKKLRLGLRHCPVRDSDSMTMMFTAPKVIYLAITTLVSLKYFFIVDFIVYCWHKVGGNLWSL